MARKQLLNDLLKENQEPFHLKNHIAEKQSQFKNNSVLQVKKQSTLTNMRKHACFLSFQNSPDVKKSPLFSPVAMSPNGAVFLHIPSKTAALLVEAAMKIHKQRNSSNKPKSQSKNGLFGSLLKRLKDRSKKKKRGAIEMSSLSENVIEEEDKRLDFDEAASTSTSCCSECSREKMSSGFCTSPFRFSLRLSPSCSGQCTPEFCSPVGSPIRHVQQENENFEIKNSNNVQEEEEEEKEQCSPVSVLDPPFEDDGHESGDDEEDEYDVECSFENVQRAKQQLLYRLRRFEELAELDPMELEKKLLEGSDSEEVEETKEYEAQETLSCSSETLVAEVFNQSSLQNHSKKMSPDMKRLVSDLIVEEKSDVSCSGSQEVVLGRIRKRLASWKEVQFNTIDMMCALDFKREIDGWRKFPEQGNEIVAEIELTIFVQLVEELSKELLGTDLHHQELNVVPIEST